MGWSFGALIALLLLVCPGAKVARCAGPPGPVAVAVGSPLTYGVVAPPIVPFGALGIPRPRVAAAVHTANIRYVITGTPVVRGFAMPDGLVSLDSSRSWTKIYDNGAARRRVAR